jgi:MFS family permease
VTSLAATSRGALRARLAALSVAQVVSWGVLYYATIVGGFEVARDTGWSLTLLMSLFSVGMIVSAVAGIFVGRLLDERGPRLVMSTGSAVAVVGFAVVALAPNPITFGIGWIVVGVAQSAVLYQAAFTVITRRYGHRRQGPLTILTLAGGLASTIFAPIVAGLLAVTDWRTSFLILAGILAVVTIPIHALSLERRWPAHPPPRPDEDIHTVSTVLRTRRFWFLELSTILVTISLFGVTLALIPLFVEKGMTFELAAIALGILGAGQVVGRLVFLVVPRGMPPWLPLVVVCGLSALLMAALGFLPGPVWLLIGVGTLAGAVRGAMTLIQATAVADRWGTRNYGAINGAFAAPVTIVAAITPAAGVAIAAGAGSYAFMAVIMAGVAVIGMILARAS